VEEDTLNFTPEEIKSMAEALAKALTSQNINVQDYTHVICEAEVVTKIDLSAISSSAMGITDILGQISAWITSLANSVSSWAVSAVQTFVSNTISGLQNFINNTVRPLIVSSIVGFINDWVMPVIEGITPKITGYISTYIVPFLQDISPKIANVITTLSGAIAGAITSISNAIASGISTIGNSIASSTTTILASLSSGISSLGNAIAGAITSISSAIASAISSIGSSIASASRTILDSIASGIKSIGNSIASSITAITSAISTSITSLSESFSRALNNITSSISNLGTTLSTAISSMATSFTNALLTLLNAMSSGFTSLARLIESIYTPLSTIATLISSIPENVLTNMRNFILAVFSQPIQPIEVQVPSKEFMEKLTREMSAFGATLGEFMTILPPRVTVITPVVKSPYFFGINTWIGALENPIGWFAEKIYSGLQQLGEHIWGTITWLGQVFFQKVDDTFKKLVEIITGGLRGIATVIYNAVAGAVSTAIGVLLSMVDAIASAFKAVGATISNLLSGTTPAILGILNALESAFKPIVDLIYKPFMMLFPTYLANTIVKPFIVEAKANFGISSPEELGEKYVTQQTVNMWSMAGLVAFSPIMASVGIRALIWNAKAIGSFFENLVFEFLLKFSPVGIGGEGRFDLSKAVGGAIKQFIWSLPELLEHYESGLVYGFAIWMSQPYSKLINYYLRNFIPIRLPQEYALLEMTRRYLPLSDSTEMVKVAKYYLALEGYSDFIINRMVEIENPPKITVTDRFNYTREIPLSLVYELPSASDVATMMVRDIFPTFDEFQKIYNARGMHPDVGALYYFLRFRYPPPERLWAFTMRGISGLLWATLPDTERQQIAVDADPIHAFYKSGDLRAPAELNFDTTTLLNSFKTYMKWHDYARFAWVKGFTSDNLIMVDTLADIPTKIDQRWMVKWGVYETLSEKGVTYRSPIQEFVTKYISPRASSEIQMDLTNFCRTLQATGIHPYWIPVTAVAEAMNVLTEERTLLRTGFMGLFKEGFYNIESLETMLSGFITASFQIAYFDISKSQWYTAYVNQPIMFLPPERRLLELRALMDRALDILREIQKDISIAYQEYIVWDYNEYKSKLTQVIDSINVFYARDYKIITGVDLPDQLKLQFVEDYYKPYVEALRIWRDVFTIRRVRMWTQRWIGWVMYRVAYGGVEKSDVEKLVAYVSDKAKLTEYETAFIKDVMTLMYGIARQTEAKEYIPTPLTLASMTEVVPEARQFFDEVVKAKNVPEAWQPLWAKYVDYKPIIDEVKKMVSKAESLYEYFAITEDDYKKVLDSIKYLGWTDKEIEFMLSTSRYVRWLRAFRETVGDVDRMTMLAEYSPEARSFALGQLYKMIDAMPIDDATKATIKKMWEQFIRIKPVKDEVMTYVRDIVNLYVAGLMSRDDLAKELNWLKQWGLDDYEIDFWLKIADARKAKKLKIPVIYGE